MTADASATLNDPMYGYGTTTAYTGTAGVTAALVQGAQAVWVVCSTAAHGKIGVGATAVVDVDMAVPANTPVALPVKVIGSRVSAVMVTGGSGGNLYVMPLFS